MPSREYYRQQAERLFELARASSDPERAKRLIERANDYQMLAAAMPGNGPPPEPPVDQTVQQQQQKAGDSQDE
jgi:hypothetical protein